MHKEHVIDLATGKIAYPDAHTTKGRLAYIDLYRQIGHTEWRKRFLHVYIGKSQHFTSKNILLEYGLLDEHKCLLNAYYQNRINQINKEIELCRSDLEVVEHTDHLIFDYIEQMQNDIEYCENKMIKNV